MAIRAVIFDLDGVIVSTDAYHYEAWKSIADQEGIYFDEEINHRLRGVSRMESLEIILERAARSYSEEEKQRLAQEKNAYYVKLLERLSPDAVSPEVRELIAALKARGIKVAIGSSSRNAPRILERIGLQATFDAVVDGSDIERAKPAPDLFLLAARRLGVSPKDCLVVEDAESGILAAKAAGMKAAAVGEGRLSRQADYALASVSDVLAVLSKGEAEGEKDGEAGSS